MIGPTRTLSLVATVAVALASCSGSGTSTNVAPHATPSSGSHAQATITIRYTQGTHRLKASALRRSPRFVDPGGSTLSVTSSSSTNPSFSTSTTIAVAPAPDGTQAIVAPIVSSPGATDTTQINVAEVDAGANNLALGQATLTSVQPGTLVQAPAITLYMVVAGIGITTDPLNGSGAVAISKNAGTPTAWSAPCSGQSFLFAFDAVGSWATLFNTPLGVGGIPTPQIFTQLSDNGGTSRLVSTQTNGVKLILDTNGDGVTAHVQTYDINPANNNILQSTSDGYVDFRDSC